MGTTFEREPAEILLSMRMNNHSNVTSRRSPAKRPLEEKDAQMETKPTIGTTTITSTETRVSHSGVFTYSDNNNVKVKRYLESNWESDQPPVQEEVEITATQAVSSDFNMSQQSRQSARTKERQALLPKLLKESLKHLKNLLKLPKARQWVFCEFFFSDVDRELLFSEQEYRECLRESFPNLKTHQLKRAEWRQVRRLIGRPRRCSQAFFDLERAALAARRSRIRDLHNGATVGVNNDEIYIPLKVPKPLVVGAKVYARVRYPKDGVYGGIVDAVVDGGYRIIFDKDVVMPLIVPDYEVMSLKPEELVPVTFFLEKNKAAQPPAVSRSNFQPMPSNLVPSAPGVPPNTAPTTHDPVLTSVTYPGASSSVAASATTSTIPASAPIVAPPFQGTREDRCGNHPLRLVVMLVKLSKLMDMKKVLISQVQEMNNEAERMHLYADRYIKKFQERYAKAVLDLEQVNRQMETYLHGTSEYVGALLPQLTEISVTSRPEALQKFCYMHSSQIVKNMSRTLNVRSGNAFELVSSLTALLLQIRALGQQQCNAHELHSLHESMKNIKDTLHPQNRSVFEDHAEVHVKQIEFTMRGGERTATLSNLFS